MARRVALLLVICAPTLGNAADGEIEINQATAVAGGVGGNPAADPPGFPVRITHAGSYRLTGNLTVAGANDTAIQVAADDVTIDLAGFRLAGPITCSGPLPTTCSGSGSGRGIDAATARGVRVHGGTVRGFGAGAIVAGDGAQVVEVNALQNAGGGFQVGAGSVVRNSLCRRNDGRGIVAGDGSLIEAVISSENGSDGIQAGADSLLSWNFVENNEGSGVRAGPGSAVAANLTGYNLRSGIVILGPGEVSESLAHGHLLCGISAGPGALVHNNVTATNGRALFANANSSSQTGFEGNVFADGIAVGYPSGEPGPVDLGANHCAAGTCNAVPSAGETTCE